MKRVNDGYLKIIIYAIFGLIFIVSTYLVVINIRHYKALSYQVTVSEADTSYINFKKNINELEEKLSHYSNNDKTITSLKETLKVLKSGGVFHLLSNTKLTYYDLYTLNDYFMNDIINDCWVGYLKGINVNQSNTQIINLLVNNANYMSNHFMDNGLTLYDSYSENNIQNDYAMILNNYLSFSNIVLSLIKS